MNHDAVADIMALPTDPKKEPEIAIRTALVTAAIGYLAGPRIHLPAEVTAPLGLILGWLLDHVLFKIKAALVKDGANA